MLYIKGDRRAGGKSAGDRLWAQSEVRGMQGRLPSKRLVAAQMGRLEWARTGANGNHGRRALLHRGHVISTYKRGRTQKFKEKREETGGEIIHRRKDRLPFLEDSSTRG